MTWNRSPFTPMVLLVQNQEWTARSFESILAPHGCGVFKAYTGTQGLDVVRRLIPDLILVDQRLPDMTGVHVLRRLRAAETVHSSTPRALISTSPLGQTERMAALEEGAWDILVPPFDPAELILRFDTWIVAKRDADRARDQGLVDPVTGLYNFNGLLRRIDELVSDASRHERDISLVAVGALASGQPSGDRPLAREDLTRRVGMALGEAARISDAIARVGPLEFVILAPGTDLEGAEKLANRVLAASGRGDLRAGVHSVQRTGTDAVAPLDLLNRATSALRRAQTRSTGPLVFTEGMLAAQGSAAVENGEPD
ncbi:MAG: response regulator [Gemmatimonadota bacterium]|jgi:PleD family two-component response regulator